jgi:NitT/TauT family transport system ATP-binding protein
MTFRSKGSERTVLKDLSFHVGHGEVVGIVGRSGTGKTTLLRLLSGLQTATSGQVLFDGTTLEAPSPRVMTVFQDYNQALLPWRTVAKNVALGLERRQSRAEVRERTTQALRMVHLEDNADDFPWQLSGGMQQRVQIARALAMEPEVLLLDEPFGALDAMTRASLQDELLTVQRNTGVTVVFITHDIDEAIYLADRVVVLSGAPATITGEVSTDLPRLREQLTTREATRFLTGRRELSTLLRGERDE